MAKRTKAASAAGAVPTRMMYSGIPITLDEYGRFNAAVDDITISEERLTDARAKIDRALTVRKSVPKVKISLPVIVIPSEGNGTEYKLANIIGVHRTTREIQLDGDKPKGPRWPRKWDGQAIIADTPANRERVAAYLDQRAKWGLLRENVDARSIEVDGYGKIDIDEYDGVIAKLTTKHKVSAK